MSVAFDVRACSPMGAAGGRLDGEEILRRLQGTIHSFWFDRAAFHPDTAIWAGAP
jgi:hypothetical protein